jgi:hypothetical protein
VFKFAEQVGTLTTGAPADVTVIDLQQGQFQLFDQKGGTRTAKQRFVPVAAVHGGTLTKIDPAVHEAKFAGVKSDDLLLTRFLIAAFVAAAGLRPCWRRRRRRSWTASTRRRRPSAVTPRTRARCVQCHEGLEADGPGLMDKAFLDRWREDTLEPLFTFIKTTMPGNTPGGLDDAVYADILAYLLEANGLPAGQRELSPEMVGASSWWARRATPLANLTIVRAVGCLTAQANDAWALVNASGPGRFAPGSSRGRRRKSSTRRPRSRSARRRFRC